MATRAEKTQQVRELVDKLQQAQGVVLVDFRGLTVAENGELRRRLRQYGVEFKVVKNTLARRAARQVGLEGGDGVFEGPTAMAFAYQDPVIPAKELTRFSKEVGKLQIKAGILGKRFVEADAVEKLAALPPREELLAKVVGGAAGPLYGFAAVTSGLLRKFVYAVDALRRERESAA